MNHIGTEGSMPFTASGTSEVALEGTAIVVFAWMDSFDGLSWLPSWAAWHCTAILRELYWYSRNFL